MRLAALLFVLCPFAPELANGDDRVSLAGLPGEVPNTARRIAAADKLAAQKRWPEAIEEYQAFSAKQATI